MSYENFSGEDMSKRTETERQLASITWLGPLHQGVPDKAIWSGTISAIHAPENPILYEECKAELDGYFVSAHAGKSVRCIDGRPREGALEASIAELERQDLGPQVPGGTPAMALSFRLAKPAYPERLEAAEEFMSSPNRRFNTIIGDFIEVHNQYEELGLPFPSGGHIDDHAQYPNTGCGAIDNLPKIMERMVDHKALALVEQYTRAITGDDFQEDAFNEILAILARMNEPRFKNFYLMRQNQDLGMTDYREIAVESLKANAGEEAIERMVGDHKEFILIINKRDGDTFNRDLFCRANDNGMQVFNYDYWHTLERANQLYAEDEAARARFLMSRAMYAVAAAMVLTDGSLEVGIRE
jgi:hypothetical protein